MGSKFTWLIIDAHDPDRLSRFWSQALDYEIDHDEDDDDLVGLKPKNGEGPGLAFAKVPDDKIVKNRLHIDLNPTDCEQAEEVQRLLSLGARKVDIGQGEVSWVVLADPEGNEFCVLRSRAD